MPVPAQNINITTFKRAKLSDTLNVIVNFINSYSWQVADLASELKGENDYETGRNIWRWVKNNIKYEPDGLIERAYGLDVEQVRTPARTIADGKGDCDCMTVLIGSLLKENNIVPFAKVVAFPKLDEFGNFETDFLGNYKSGGFSHIYSFFYYQNTPVFLDTVPEIKQYNTEYKPIVKYKIVDMELQELHGILGETLPLLTEEEDYDNEYNNPSFDEDEDDDYSDFYSDDEDELELPLSSDVIFEEALLGRIVFKEDPNGSQSEQEVVNSIIKVTLLKFKKELEKDLVKHPELQYYQDAKKELELVNLILNSPNDELFINLEHAIDNSNYSELYESCLEELEDNEDEDEDGEAEQIRYEPVIIDDINERIEARQLNGLGKLFKRRNKEERRKRRAERRARRKERRANGKGFLNVAKKVTLAPARASFIQLVKLNAMKLGTKLVLAQRPYDQVKHIVSKEDHQKLVNAYGKFKSKWVKLGGKESTLNKAVSKSKANKKLSLHGLGVDPVTATAGLLASAAPILAIVKKLFGGVKLKKGRKTRMPEIPSEELNPDASDYSNSVPAIAPAPAPAPARNFFQKLKGDIKQAFSSQKPQANSSVAVSHSDAPPTEFNPGEATLQKKGKSKKLLLIGVGVVVVGVVLIVFLKKQKTLSGVQQRQSVKRKTTATCKQAKRKTTATRKPTTRRTTATRKPTTRRTTATRKPATRRTPKRKISKR